ncbi:hypothetical protein CJ010_04085 [Azoarcus sp. DD4]|uniref:hypothetical protein n=1 Tax=Azoarcus sp. DD4 TaxID=2027405 RepID=UPI001129CCD2|nr:hypothetical protein [Azoarcus sp. DD4]QDF95787.1 hypothetical protein CJ010_04085 [Azoarcus sp. DD4]
MLANSISIESGAAGEDRLSVVVQCMQEGDRPAACVAFGDFRATLRETLQDADLGGVLRDTLTAFSQSLGAADTARCSGLAGGLREQLRAHFPKQADRLLRFC